MNNPCLIISGGTFAPLPTELERPQTVIACDRGWQYARQLGLTPDLVIGDFDSAPPPGDGAVIRLPTRKDDTDTMFAARRALEQGCREIVICCAFGGRLDHTLANLQTAAFLVSHGARVRLLGEDTEAAAFTGATERFPRRAGWSLSVFALSERCEGVSIHGAKYECEQVVLTNTFPLGVSNLVTAEYAEITVERGILLVLRSKLKDGEHI